MLSVEERQLSLSLLFKTPSIMPLGAFFFYQLFSTFSTKFFLGSISIRIDTLWVQLLLEFSTNHFKL